MVAKTFLKQRIQKKTDSLIKTSLKAPMSEGSLMFSRAFLGKLLKESGEMEEQPVASPIDEFSPDKNKADFEASLDKGTDPGQFDVQGKDPVITGENLSVVKEFSEKIQEFVDFLNDYRSGNSLHQVLAANDVSGNPMKGVSRKISDSITRSASELSKISEVLNSFIILAPKKMKDVAATQQIQA